MAKPGDFHCFKHDQHFPPDRVCLWCQAENSRAENALLKGRLELLLSRVEVLEARVGRIDRPKPRQF